MEPPKKQRLNFALALPAFLVLLLFGALVGVGWMFGSMVVIAASVYWILNFSLMLGAHRQVVHAQPTTRLPFVRVGFALLVLTVALVLSLILFRFEFPLETVSPPEAIRLGAMLLGFGFGGAVLARYFQSVSSDRIPDAPGLVQVGRVGAWLSVFGSVSLFATYFELPSFEGPVSALLLAVPALLGCELLLTGLITFIPRSQTRDVFGTDLLTTRVLGSSYNPIQSIFTSIEVTFGVDVRSSWALGFLRQVSLPVIVGLGLCTWVLSSFVVVDASQQGVRERFGKADSEKVLEPGLHIGLPWPLDRVHRINTHRVREIPLGYTGAKADADALWTQYHAAEEFNLLLGDGRDLVTINADLQYRIGDVYAWIYGCQNPEEAMETLAYRVLMEATVDRTLDEVLSQDIARFSESIHSQIQQQADSKGLGVEVVAFSLRGLHPPVAVAEDYQAVVAAQLDRTTYIIEAEAYRQSALPMAEAAALGTQRSAEAESVTRLTKALGEAIAFNTLEAQYKTNTQLFRFRRQLETLEKVLVNKPHYVIDARIEQDGGSVWILE